jgi:hypothetical protein
VTSRSRPTIGLGVQRAYRSKIVNSCAERCQETEKRILPLALRPNRLKNYTCPHTLLDDSRESLIDAEGRIS